MPDLDIGTYQIISSCVCSYIDEPFNMSIDHDKRIITYHLKNGQSGDCVCSLNKKRTVQKEQLIETMPLPNDLTNIVLSYIGTPFIVVLHPQPSGKIIIPSISSTDGLYIDWDDGCSTTHFGKNFLNIKHECDFNRDYIVHIYGNITDISFQYSHELREISQWGCISITNGIEVFRNCINFESITAIDTPSLKHCTNIMGMFYNCVLFNGDLSKWNISNVTNMSDMFLSCKLFNGDLSKWNTSNVTDMAGMFHGCKAFNRDLSTWNVSKVNNMMFMFKHCNSFNRDLSRWDVSNVTKMHEMFNCCKSFNRDLSKWNTSNVTDMHKMFNGCKLFNRDLSEWNTSNVTDMRKMFRLCKSFNEDLSKWNTSKVTNMDRMFIGCKTFNGDLSKWNVLNVTRMFNMMYDCISFSGNLSEWDVSNVTDTNFDKDFINI